MGETNLPEMQILFTIEDALMLQWIILLSGGFPALLHDFLHAGDTLG